MFRICSETYCIYVCLVVRFRILNRKLKLFADYKFYCHMYAGQEALLLLIDVGPSMHNVLLEVEKICSMLVQKKVWFSLYFCW